MKNLSNLSNEKLNTFLSLIMGVLGKRRVGRDGERGINKWNHGKIIETS